MCDVPQYLQADAHRPCFVVQGDGAQPEGQPLHVITLRQQGLLDVGTRGVVVQPDPHRATRSCLRGRCWHHRTRMSRPQERPNLQVEAALVHGETLKAPHLLHGVHDMQHIALMVLQGGHLGSLNLLTTLLLQVFPLSLSHENGGGKRQARLHVAPQGQVLAPQGPDVQVLRRVCEKGRLYAQCRPHLADP